MKNIFIQKLILLRLSLAQAPAGLSSLIFTVRQSTIQESIIVSLLLALAKTIVVLRFSCMMYGVYIKAM